MGLTVSVVEPRGMVFTVCGGESLVKTQPLHVHPVSVSWPH